MKKVTESSERALFYSIWIVILIAVAFWKLRPATERNAADIPVVLAPEVQPWFSEAVVQRAKGNALTIGFVLTPEYRRTLRTGSSEVRVGYRISVPSGQSVEGATTVRLSSERTLGEARLVHESREPASQIDLFLKK